MGIVVALFHIPDTVRVPDPPMNGMVLIREYFSEGGGPTAAADYAEYHNSLCLPYLKVIKESRTKRKSSL
jgi:hypothetical protein